MTKITVYVKDNIYSGICIAGHSGFADEGEDIVCAGISVLAINFINSVEKFTTDKFQMTENEDDGIIDFQFLHMPDSDAQLLLKSLVLGLEEMEKEYNDFISLDYKEV